MNIGYIKKIDNIKDRVLCIYDLLPPCVENIEFELEESRYK